MEFLSLSRRRSSSRNVPSGEERGETDVFAGYPLACYNFSKNFDFSNFSQFLQKSQFLLYTFVPPVTLDLINFSKNCNFSNYLQFLEKSQKLQKSQFLLDALVPPFNYHLYLVIFTKTAISPVFRNFCYCVQTWTFICNKHFMPAVGLVQGSNSLIL